MMFDGGDYSPEAAAFAADYLSGINTISKKKKFKKNKRRFSDEQITSLETLFESETKLEPRKKLELARELGLQPRQVAIWFQNKRARWKSKQLERDYSVLRSNYHNLASQFEVLKKEKQALVIQLQKLNGLMEQSRKESQRCSQEIGGNSIDRSSNNTQSEFEIRPSLALEGVEYGVGVLSDDDNSIKAEYLGLVEESDPLNMVEHADSSLTSTENWGNLNTDLLDQPSCDSQWWDFWS